MQLLRESVNVCSDKISDFEVKLSKINDYFKATDILKVEQQQLKKQVSQANRRVDNIERLLRSNNVEIQDIPEKAKENLIDLAKDIGGVINFQLDESMIDTIFRVPSQVESKPKNIVIRFISKINRDHFLAAAKSARKNSGDHKSLRLRGLADKFYINEHLPSHTKFLLKQARETAKAKGYKFVWIQGGNVLMRKTEQAKIIQITGSEQLDSL